MPLQCARCERLITSPLAKKYCSVNCSIFGAAKASGIARTKRYVRACRQCNAEIITDGKGARKVFCNHSCAATFRNTGRFRAPLHRCPRCDGRSLNGKYCSRDCRSKHRLERWLAGEFDLGTRKYGISYFVRQYLETKNENKCEMCGFDQRHSDGASIHETHHRDGDWMNNDPANLQFLCPNCHALTDNYRARNKKNGRKWKAKYKKRHAGMAE